MISAQLVDLSRLQFAATAVYHFLFVPLTLGMVWLLVIMESMYVMTGDIIWKDMTRFWGKLFGINFALGVTTGITLEFQFGTNWAYYSHYVGDIVGAPLAIEGLLAFFLESTFIGLFFFGWDRLTKTQHLMVTRLLAVGTNLCALWILIANGWMQNPVGAEFRYQTMRMEMTDFWAVVFNPDAQAMFVHTVSAGYVTGAMFVLAVSSWYLLKGRDIELAKRSFRVASAFGLASVLSVIVLGDESGYTVGEAQQTKMAALEAMWETEPKVTPMFWSFRIMMGLGFAMLVLFALSFWSTLKSGCRARPWLLRAAVLMLPVLWTIYGVLPTHMSVSRLSVNSLYGSLAGFIGFYTVLLIVEIYLMQKFARQGPGSLGTGRYQFEPAHRRSCSTRPGPTG